MVVDGIMFHCRYVFRRHLCTLGLSVISISRPALDLTLVYGRPGTSHPHIAQPSPVVVCCRPTGTAAGTICARDWIRNDETTRSLTLLALSSTIDMCSRHEEVTRSKGYARYHTTSGGVKQRSDGSWCRCVNF
jgi:hypothetical protein